MLNNETDIPYYAVHSDGKICGFFGPFRFLSNFYILEEHGVCYQEMYYPSVEHAYQAAKYPYEEREKFLNVASWEAKKMGKSAPKFNANVWNKHKYSFMSELNYQKYIGNPKLKKMLLMTDGCHLEERNNWGDVWWGTDIDGKGLNNLGKILMTIRDRIKSNMKDEF